MLIETPAGLFCPAGGFHIDPWQPVPRAVITHAHGDHARPGNDAYLCTTDCARLLRRRFGSEASIQNAEYGEVVQLDSVSLSFHPAGHVLGSAQVRLETADGVWVISGDYKRAPDSTCDAFEPLRCDTFITESTFALPIYRWDPTDRIVGDIMAWWSENAAAGRSSVLFCYTIGKTQRVLAELGRLTDRTLFVHGMMLPMIEAYREAGVTMLRVASATERPRGFSFA